MRAVGLDLAGSVRTQQASVVLDEVLHAITSAFILTEKWSRRADDSSKEMRLGITEA